MSRQLLCCLMVVQCTTAYIESTKAFAPATHISTTTRQHSSSLGTSYFSSSSSSTCLPMGSKKKNPSMADLRKRRQEKSQGAAGGRRSNPFADLPPSKLNVQSSSTTATSDVDHPKDEIIQVTNPTAAAERAKELLNAQRVSVSMLTLVRERVLARLSADSVSGSLEEHGYAIVDDFLGDESILNQLEREGLTMLEGDGKGQTMELDVSNLGSGEYIAKIEGGDEQYRICPRIVELVVSTTKHVPEAFEAATSSGGCIPYLNPSACMATLRTFDRKAWKASLSLLTGQEEDAVFDKQDQLTTSLETVVSDDGDQRKLSLYYYLLSESWMEEYGGGLIFESGKATAKRDRLVIFLSDTTKHKRIPWKGSDGDPSTMVATSIELHVLKKR